MSMAIDTDTGTKRKGHDMTPEEAIKTVIPIFNKRRQQITSMRELSDSYIISGTMMGLESYGAHPIRIFKSDGHYEDFILPDNKNFQLLHESEPVEIPDNQITDSRTIAGNIRSRIGETKVPHRVSQPVIIKDSHGSCCLGAFIFYFKAEDIKSGLADRPTKWLTADIETGGILHIYNSKEKEFSDASYEVRYDISGHGEEYDLSERYTDRMYNYLDAARLGYIQDRNVDWEAYEKYKEMLLKNIPPEYRRFFQDLENVDSYKN